MFSRRKKVKKTSSRMTLFLLVFCGWLITAPVLFYTHDAYAQWATTEVGPELQLSIWQKIWNSLQKSLKTAGDVAFKNMLKRYLDNLAYNMATKIATGQPGQKPTFPTKPLNFLKDAGDAAAGDFLNMLVNETVPGKCEGSSYKTCLKDSDCPPAVLACKPLAAEVATGQTINPAVNPETKDGYNWLLTNRECVTVNCTESSCDVPPEGYNVWSTVGICNPASINLCTTDVTLKLKLSGFARQYIEGTNGKVTSVCPLSDIIKNAKQTYHQKLVDLQLYFNPQANQLGMFGEIISEGQLFQTQTIGAKEFAQSLAGEFFPQTTKISGQVKAPGVLIQDAFSSVQAGALDPYVTYTGSAIADAVGVFTNTLASKLMDKYIFGKGFNPGAVSPSTGSPSGLAGSAPGVAAAKLLFSSISETNYSVGGDVDLLGQLASCPDKSDPLPTNCVIDNSFRTAIEQQLTVREALDQGLLGGSKVFGYDANNREPDYLSGYPYRTLLILRKYRIVPVGWELAAEYIKNYAGGNYSLTTLIQEYDNVSSPFYHLIDPNWVLKSPAVFCKKQGASPKIAAAPQAVMEDTNHDGSVNNKDIAVTTVQREDYCADEQTCVAEADDGTCLRYGYCIEEKPVWKFEGESCLAQYNTCQTFQRRDGISVSYLKNTININGCDASNAGCQNYYTEFNYDAKQWDTTGDQINLNKNAESCLANGEGCHEFMSVKDSGVNLQVNSDFETFTGTKDDGTDDNFPGWSVPGVAEAVPADGISGQTSAKLQANDALISEPIDTGSINNDRSFTVSFYAKADNTSCGANSGTLTARLGRPITAVGNVLTEVGTINLTDAWTRYSGTVYLPKVAGNLETSIYVFFQRNDCAGFIDNVQVEEGGLTSYKTYEDSPKLYVKKSPDYLDCANNPTRVECAAFALACAADEVGCQAFTSVSTGEVVNGTISNPLGCNPLDPSSCNQCPAQYAGCKAYRELAITHVPQRQERDPVSFVAATGVSCPASAVGCEEYTNLDEVAQGGEGKEYYSLIRQCVEADAAGVASYYSWEGSDEFGYQLKNYRLKSTNVGGSNAPCTNMNPEGGAAPAWPDCNDSSNSANTNYWAICADPAVDTCNLATNQCNITNAACVTNQDCIDYRLDSNPDCTEFYDEGGTTFYRLKSRVVYASDQCTNYRNSIDGASLIYHMIPGQGLSCSAAYAGCRAYKGNTGDNVRTIYQNNFENGSVDPWTGNVSYSNESVQQGGHSMLVANVANYNNVGTELGMAAGNSYSISFWAKAAAAETNISVVIDTGVALAFPGQATARNGEWNRYELGPLFAPENADLTAARLSIFSTNAFYLDSIVLRQVRDNVYYIKDSYQECSGWENCDEYVDRNNSTHYLKSFTKLCSPDKVGCSAMIDTQNSGSPFETVYPLNSTPPVNNLTVPADTVTTLVNDPAKYCTANDKGCQLLGKPNLDNNLNIVNFTDTFVRNNPDDYENTLCLNEEVGCEEYSVTGSSPMYFKDPGERTCEYKRVTGQDVSGWYKKGTTSGAPDCPTTGGVCTAGPNIGDWCDVDSDCGGGGTCSPIPERPIEDATGPWVGMCQATASGCTEIRDPEDPNFCNAQIPGDCKSYYYISSTLDKGSCNGVVSRDEGCRLFYDTSSTTLNYSADNSEDKKPPVACSDPTGPAVDCNANTLIKIRRDRVCGAWLECKSAWPVKNNQGKSEDLCIQLGACDQFDPDSGQCTHPILQSHANETYNSPVYVDEIKNYSGLVTAGLEWGRRCQSNPNIVCTNNAQCKVCNNDVARVCATNADCQNGGSCPDDAQAVCSVAPQIIQGYYPYSTMNEIGLDGASSQDMIQNGDFGDSNAQANQRVSDYIASRNKPDGVTDWCDVTGNPWCNRQVTPAVEALPEEPLATAEFEVWNNTTFFGAIAGVGEETADGAISSFGSPNLDENNVLIVTHPAATPIPAWWGVSVSIPEISSSQEFALSYRVKRSALPADSGDRVSVYLYWDAEGTPVHNGGFTWLPVISSNDVGTDWKEFTVKMNISDLVDDWIASDPANLQPGDKSDIMSEINTANDFRLRFQSRTGSAIDFYLDDVSMKPVLEVQNPPSPATLVRRSCRMYPESDASSCTYTDENSVTHRGWYGYCLEADPQNPSYCLNWWPIDIISGETNIFGAVTNYGYGGRSPLYMCVQAAGNNNQGAFSGDVECQSNNNHCGDDVPIELCGKQPTGYYRIFHGHIAGGDVSEDSDCNTDHGCGRMYSLAACDDQTISGICGCDETPVTAGWRDITDPADQYYEWQIEKIYWTAQAVSHNDWRPTRTDPGQYIPGVGDVYFITDRSNNWGNDSGSGRWEFESNILEIRVEFNAQHRLSRVYAYMHDGSNNEGGAWVQGVIQLREYCTEIARVVQSNGDDRAWTGRTTQLAGYKVPDLLFGYTQDYVPFGGIVQPASLSDPESWSAASGLGPLYIQKTSVSTSRGGSPYSCANANGCRNRICSTGENDCSDAGEISACYDGLDGQIGTPSDNGYCIGLGTGFCDGNNTIFCDQDSDCGSNGPCTLPTYPNSGGAANITDPQQAIMRIRELFADAYDAWTWNPATGEYDNTPNLITTNWQTSFADMTVCPGNNRTGAYPADYCGVTPDANNFSVGSGNQTHITVNKAQLIQLNFNMNVNPEQLPIQSVEVAWDNDILHNSRIQGPFGSGPMVLTHFYEVPGIYTPRVQIVDNWSFCSDTTAGGTLKEDTCSPDPVDWKSSGIQIEVLP